MVIVQAAAKPFSINGNNRILIAQTTYIGANSLQNGDNRANVLNASNVALLFHRNNDYRIATKASEIASRILYRSRQPCVDGFCKAKRGDTPVRYVVKAYTVHEDEQRAAQEAIANGIIADAETLEGFVQGTCDEAGVAELARRGLTILAAQPIDDNASAAKAGGNFSQFSQKMAGGGFAPAAVPSVKRPDGRRNYFLIRLRGALTRARRTELGQAGVTILERRDDDWYVAKLRSRRSIEQIAYIVDARLYDAEETVPPEIALESFGMGARAVTPAQRLRIYEATLHADADATSITQELGQLGADIITSGGRVVRFAPSSGDLEAIADIPEIAEIHEVRPARLFDDHARLIVGLDAQPPLPPRLIAEAGEGELIGVADTGIDDAHRDFIGRIEAAIALGRPNNVSDPHGHGTHVAGTILGDGTASNGLLAGMAPKARLYFQSLLDVNGGLGGLPDDLKDLFQPAYDAGVRIHNNSWGAFLHSRYAGNAMQVDAFVFSHPDFLPVIAAGNDGSCLPGVNSGSAGFVDHPSLATPASAKNGLTVGASRNSRTSGGYAAMTWGDAWEEDFTAPPIRDETISGNIEGLAGFSGRGPSDDRRIKPDLTAPGTDIASTRSRHAPLRNFWGAYPGSGEYAFMGGTSMASPVVAGCAAIVRQYYLSLRDHQPSSALLKATLINGTATMTHSDALAPPEGFPNYHQGFGRLNLRGSLPNPAAPDIVLEYIDTFSQPGLDFADSGERRRWQFDVKTNGEVRLCLVWADPPGRGLQNTLMMTVDEGPLATKWFSNARIAGDLRFPTPATWAGGMIFQRDPNNNVHIIRIPDAAVGSYTVSVVADNILFPAQSFALVMTGPVSALDQLL